MAGRVKAWVWVIVAVVVIGVLVRGRHGGDWPVLLFAARRDP